MLIILSGLPGVGKTTIATALARELDAVHVRIDAIEQTLRESGTLQGPMDDAGYRVGYATAEEHLQVGRTVIADSVNPLAITREAWRQVAVRAGVSAVEVEIVCSDADAHRRRVETRAPDIERFILPTWTEVMERHYEPWDRPRVVIDTARHSVEECVAELRRGRGAAGRPIDIR